MITTSERETELHLIRAHLDSPVVFVPTMGALHQGHAALISRAASLSSAVIVSIFVNPLQFEDPTDFAKYPNTLAADKALAVAAGAKFVWAPTFEEVYPNEIEKISAGKIGSILEGASRAGHFDGVLTVVKRLFELVRPDIAIFGEKDFQQLFLIKKLAKQMGVEIITHPTVRDKNGLALSSRNIRLSEAGRDAAQAIHRALIAAKNSPWPKKAMYEILRSEPAFSIDYAEIIDEESFVIIEDFNDESRINHRALIAGWVEGIRLIDTMSLAVNS